jgi:two-component system CheB/CheR fusion protein
LPAITIESLAFPSILQGKLENETIRVWVAGCATGEEAFSIGILLNEYLNEAGAVFPAQIFTSNLTVSAIEKARTGK